MAVDAVMFVRTSAEVSDNSLKVAAWDMCAYLGAGSFRDEHPLYKIDRWFQGGSAITPRPTETFIRVGLLRRYYGPGYERGDLRFLIALAEWLEQRFEPCEVWYGGDSSGFWAHHFDRPARDALKLHFYKVGHDPYQSSPGKLVGDGIGRPPQCARCVPERSPHRSGFGKDYAVFDCGGCGRVFITRDGGRTWGSGSSYDEAERAYVGARERH